jgi:hypothetical protein
MSISLVDLKNTQEIGISAIELEPTIPLSGNLLICKLGLQIESLSESQEKLSLKIQSLSERQEELEQQIESYQIKEEHVSIRRSDRPRKRKRKSDSSTSENYFMLVKKSKKNCKLYDSVFNLLCGKTATVERATVIARELGICVDHVNRHNRGFIKNISYNVPSEYDPNMLYVGKFKNVWYYGIKLTDLSSKAKTMFNV